MCGIKFFTLPPVPYPYILINLNNPAVWYVRKYRRYIREIIIDAGVEIFRNNALDYEGGFIKQLERALMLRDRLRAITRARIYVVIPDYPDDYSHGALWQDDYTNVERTLWSIFWAIDNFPYKYYIIPVQGYYEDPFSIEKEIEYLHYYGVTKTHKFYAIANLCVSRNTNTIVRTLKLARKLLGNNYIHAFGISLKAIQRAYNYIDSFDSMAWTRPVSRKLGANWSAKNLRERKKFFRAWLRRLMQIVSNGDLTQYL